MRYECIEKIGEGGMGCVYKGRDQYGNIVAIKMMSNQLSCYPQYRNLFNNEANALSKMDHPAVVHILGEPFQDQAGNLYLPMEFVEGITIEKYVEEKGAMSVPDAIKLMTNILDAMQYVHQHRCIHRDIKPSNIMIRPDGSICIIDFGIAKDAKVGGEGKTVGSIIGTDGYMSPEQASGLNIDHRTDIYSLGCLLYFMLVGRHTILKKTMEVPSNQMPSVSPALDRVFLKAVDKDMTKRFQTAEEFKKALTYPSESGTSVTIGSDPSNDFQYDSPYVSRHHLVVRGLSLVSGGINSYSLVVEDNSRNGTIVAGQNVHHATKIIPYSPTVELPQVLLAGRQDCALNWSEVINCLVQHGWMKKNGTGVKTKPFIRQLGMIGLSVVCLLIPFVGWSINVLWKEKKPRQASRANIVASLGFTLYVIILIIILF